MKLTVIIGWALACLDSSLGAHPLLERPKVVNQEALQELEHTWETIFTWNFAKVLSFTCSYQQGQSSCLLRCAGIPVRSYNFPYVATLCKQISALFAGERDYYFEKPLQCSDANPGFIDLEELCQLLKGKRFLFYTGAGLSAAGSVATMSGLEADLCLHKGTGFFLKEMFLNPQNIAKNFGTFCASALYGKPTAAHHALHTIAQREDVAIVTENVDLLQQRAGSAALSVHAQEAIAWGADVMKQIDSIVCVGISYDDCGFLAYYKKHNPQGILIALNTSIPSYISSADYMLDGDVQVVLPQWAARL